MVRASRPVLAAGFAFIAVLTIVLAGRDLSPWTSPPDLPDEGALAREGYAGAVTVESPPEGSAAQEAAAQRSTTGVAAEAAIDESPDAVPTETVESATEPPADDAVVPGSEVEEGTPGDVPVVEAPALEEAPGEPVPRPPLRPVLERLAGGLGDAIFVLEHPARPDALFLVEQSGRIRLLEGGVASTALDLRDVVRADGESGLHALAFHPHDPKRAFVFSNALDLSLVLEEYRLDDAGRALQPASRIERLRIPAAYGSHNGAALAFGPDGYLYVSVGDGGRQDDPDGRAQNLSSWHGKVLRLDIDTLAGYAIPPDNPFLDSERPEVWLYGFRNPWRMTFDPVTGDLWIADVGGSTAEEINRHATTDASGANYGWRVYEGTTWRWNEPIGAHRPPVHEYVPTSGRCAVVGGMLYRGPLEPLQGRYLFADFCDGRIRTLAQDEDGAWRASELLPTRGPVVHLSEARDGAILVLQYGGTLLRLTYA